MRVLKMRQKHLIITFLWFVGAILPTRAASPALVDWTKCLAALGTPDGVAMGVVTTNLTSTQIPFVHPVSRRKWIGMHVFIN